MTNTFHNRKLSVLAGFAGVTVVGFLDYVTGYEVRIFPLYFLPVAFVAWTSSRAWVLVACVFSAGTWVLSNWSAGKVFSSPFIWPVNFISQLVAFATVGVLVAELRRKLIIEEGLSRRDNLTSLLNTRSFHEAAELLLAVARRSSRPITFAYLDLDNFKKVNDERGHLEGDRALTIAAEVLKGQCRASDLVARLGGDEFAIVLHDTGPDGARTSLERMRDLIAVAMRRNEWPVTVSVGAVTYVRAPSTVAEAIHGADSLMYRAKQGGKNSIHIEVVEPAPGS